MPSFDYFATFDESIEILREVCQAGNRIIAVPGLFDEPNAPTFNGVNETLISILKEAPGFFVAGPFTHHPIPFAQLKAGPNAGKYTIDVMTQGPVLQGLIARVTTMSAPPKLSWGDISYQDKYRHPETGAWQGASAELKQAYRSIVSVIKKHAPPYQGRKDVYISPGALALIERGEAVIDDPRITLPAHP